MESYEEYYHRMTTKVPRPELEKLVDPWNFDTVGSRQKPSPRDMANSLNSEIATWSLTLIDEIPGPSIGDAMEYIDWLGLDWRDFRTVMVSETLNG